LSTPSSPEVSDRSPTSEVPAPRSVAVIDIGATSIRMEIAQIDAEGNIKPLSRLCKVILRVLGDRFTQRMV